MGTVIKADVGFIFNNEFVDENELLEVFDIYKRTNKYGHYILLPKSEQVKIREIFIMADKNSSRIYNRTEHERLYLKIESMLNCSHDNNLSKVDTIIQDRSIIESICISITRNFVFEKE